MTGVQVLGPMHDRYDEVLTAEALELIASLHREFDRRRRELLEERRRRVAELADGRLLDFLPETSGVRDDPSWRVV